MINKVDRWLLPDGIEELLPEQAYQTENYRRQLVDLFKSWGYDYVVPPMLEFTDSLLTGSGRDIDLLTFKMTDQVSGRTLGIRADMTPQAARMDAHSLKREGVNRLCYAGHVLHTKPKSPLSSRAPIKVGVELFGVSGLEAEVEVVSLLLETLSVISLDKQYIDFGHVGIYRELARLAELSADQENTLFALLQSKAVTDIDVWLADNISNETYRQWFASLARLSGGVKVLEQAREVFAAAPEAILKAIGDLEYVADIVSARYPSAQLYFDLSELRGYHYHTGIVFGAFAPGAGYAVANGGRYDHVGDAFGRARSATGFDVDLGAICRILGTQDSDKNGVFVQGTDEQEQWVKIQALRQQGERVVVGLEGQTEPYDYQNCDRILVSDENGYSIKPA